MDVTSGDRRRTRRRLFVVSLASLALLLLSSSSAWASQSGPRDGSGYWMYCNLSVSIASGLSGSQTHNWTVACHYGPTSGAVVQFSISFDNAPGGASNFVDGCTTGAQCKEGTFTANGRKVIKNSSGQFSMAESAGSTTSPGWAHVCINSIQIGSDTSATSFFLSKLGSNTTCAAMTGGASSVVSMTVTGGAVSASYPTQAWDGTATGTTDTVNQSDADSGAPANNATDNESCGAWWHIACHFRNVFRWVFVPSRSLSSDVSTLQSDISTHYPFGPLTDTVGALKNTWDAFKNGLTGSDPCSWTWHRPEITTHKLNGDASVIVPGGDLTILDVCNTSVVVDAVGSTTLWLSRLVFGVAFIWIMLRLVQWMLGGGGGVEG